MQHSEKYIAYRKMLQRRRRLWLLLFVGTPLLMTALFYLPKNTAAIVTFPILLLSGLLWRFFYSRADICPWCGQAFSEASFGRFPVGHGTFEPRCANCGEPGLQPPG